jgi:hypothetical protein
MPSIDEAFPSAFLKAEDLQGRNVTVTIQSATIEQIGQGRDKETKIVLALVGKQKKLVCNKTNANTIASLYGKDYTLWAGQQITLTPREVEWNGAMVWAIRVSLQKPSFAPVQQRAAVQQPPPVQHQSVPSPDADMDVPF